MLDTKQIWAIFLSSKWVIKQQKQHTTSARLAQELITNIQCSGASRSFATEVRALKVQEHSGLPLGGDKGRLRGSSKLVLLNLHEKLPKKSVSTILWLFDIWIKLERWKHSISGCLMTGLQVRKKKSFRSVVFSFCAATVNHFSIGLWCVTKSGFYMTVSGDELSGWTKKKLQSTSKSQTCTQKGHGHCLVICCWILVI